ncbi:type II toxin-antitoxin system HicB family antitoxin [Aliamphritea hakodatensis]|uniref:type II toxin-antitoxin system HicB family antitoxin n=1 Tax=Aliamphritea hakodatensis TaxID=2895352 RepID=UPI0022FDAF9B|nr:type II toxin-antitoxin system HicB family antitoxin [Aliamphritea hakodatensis]
MRYPVVIHHEENSAYGVTVPDIPGCFSAGNTMDDAIDNVREAIEFHLEGLAEDGEIAPAASPVSAFEHQFPGGTWALVDIDITPFSGKTEKVTITLSSISVRQIEKQSQKGHGKNRSAFLADSAVKEISRYG